MVKPLDLSNNMPDLSGATVGEFQEAAPKAEFVGLGDTQADITKHDSNTFAALTAQSALKTMYGQGLSPTGDDIKGVYNKALQDADEYHRSMAQEQERSALGLKQRVAAVQSGLLSAEETVKSQADLAKQQQLEQWQQTGEIKGLSDVERNKVTKLQQAYDMATNLYGYHQDMLANASSSTGGVLKNMFGNLVVHPDLTSPQTRNFDAYVDASLTPIATGAFGDLPAAATKPLIQAQMQHVLIDRTDDAQQAGQKNFLIKKILMDNVQALRDTAQSSHLDTTPYDALYGRMSMDFNKPEIQKFMPDYLKHQNDPLVQNGVSNAGTANMDAQLVASAQANQANQSYGGSASAWNQPGGIQGSGDWSGSSGTYTTQPQQQQQPQVPQQQPQQSQQPLFGL